MPEVVGILSASELKQRFELGDALTILDVREDDERAYAAIAVPVGAIDIHIPLGEVSARLEEIRQTALNRPLIVYCHHGQRSMVAATWLARQGLANLANLDGGIDAWSMRVDPGVRRY